MAIRWDVLRKQDMAFSAIPEISEVVGKIGRVDSPLDPAPISMIETVINYRSEYVLDADGRVLTDGTRANPHSNCTLTDPGARAAARMRSASR